MESTIEPRIAASWRQLREESEQARETLVRDLAGLWSELAGMVRVRVEHGASSSITAAPMATLAGWRGLATGPDEHLLAPALAAMRRLRAGERALEAIAAYERRMGALAEAMPETWPGGRAEAAATVGPKAPGWIFVRGGRHHPLPLRAAARRYVARELRTNLGWQCDYVLALAQAGLLALEPWRQARREWLRSLSSGVVDHAALTAGHRRRLRELEAIEERGARALKRAAAWRRVAGADLERALLTTGMHPERARRDDRYFQTMQFWARRQRAVAAVLDLSAALARLVPAWAEAGEAALTTLQQEHGQLVGELEAAHQWLESAQSAVPKEPFPPPAARLVAAQDRQAGWHQAAEAAVRAQMPAEVEVVAPRRRRPPQRPPWRLVEPQQTLIAGVARFADPPLLAALKDIEIAEAAMARDIERAREVVAYSLEATPDGAPPDPEVQKEGLANALALMRFERSRLSDPRRAVEPGLVTGMADSLLYAHLSMEQRRLGAWKQLARQSGSRLALELARLALRNSAAGGRRIRQALDRQTHRALRAVGWEAPPTTAPTPVAARPFFGAAAARAPRELPAIYRRLFRLAPVEEPRFLIGRQAEMAALAQARALWQSGRAVAVCVVGARGSGKTSLLNCAVGMEYADLEITRAQFRQRTLEPEAMRRFLAQTLGVDGEAGVEAALNGRRQLVMLEELEWSFLRRMGGFAGIRELLRILSSTGRSTLWIVSLNESCFRYLDAAVGFGSYFSHRINAMAVAKPDIQNAILMRHRLSGLRLQYPEPRREGNRTAWARRALGLHRSPEEVFFESLYEQTEGVFRSAFERWQSYVERVEDGVLHLREPVERDFEPMIAELNREDTFTLQALLQHGCLTDEDHAAVFECGLERSRQGLERLLAMELLEPEPQARGFRVRPEAGHLVRMALHRRNLT